MAKTAEKLLASQITQCVALGASVSEVRALFDDGMSFEDILGIYEVQHAKAQKDRAESFESQAEIHARAQKKVLRPENDRHPGISVYSNPKGDLLDPKPPFNSKMFWCGTEVDHSTSTPKEVELLNRLQPGEYVCQRGDGTAMKVTVTADKNEATGAIEKLWVGFNFRGHLKHNLLTMTGMMQEMVDQHPSAPAALAS